MCVATSRCVLTFHHLKTSRLTTSALLFRANNGNCVAAVCRWLKVRRWACLLAPSVARCCVNGAAPPYGHVSISACVFVCVAARVLASVCVQVRPVNSVHKACLFGSQQHFIPRNISSARAGAGRGGGEEVHMSRQEHTGFK